MRRGKTSKQMAREASAKPATRSASRARSPRWSTRPRTAENSKDSPASDALEVSARGRWRGASRGSKVSQGSVRNPAQCTGGSLSTVDCSLGHEQQAIHAPPVTLDDRDRMRNKLLADALSQGDDGGNDDDDGDGDSDGNSDYDDGDSEDEGLEERSEEEGEWTVEMSPLEAETIAAAEPKACRPLPPNWKKRGRAQMAKAPTNPVQRRLAEHGKHHFFAGSIRTLMSCIYKAYCPGAYAYWRQWREEDKLLCWKKFKEYYVFKEETEEDVVRKIFYDYGKTNWSKYLYGAREEAKVINKNYKSDPNAISPVPWLSNDKWRELCAIWNTNKWKQNAEKAKMNRTNPKNKLLASTCGNKPLEQRVWEIGVDEDTGEPPSQLDVFELGHKKKDGTWSTPRAESIWTGYKGKLDAIGNTMASSTGARPSVHQIDPDGSIFSEVIGGPKKGRLVGVVRGAYSPPLQRSSPDVSPSPCSPQNSVPQVSAPQDSARITALEEELARERSLREEQYRQQQEILANLQRVSSRYSSPSRQSPEESARITALEEELAREKSLREDQNRQQQEVIIELRRRQEETDAMVASMMTQMAAMAQRAFRSSNAPF